MPGAETGKTSPASKPAPEKGLTGKGLAEQTKANSELLQSLSNRLSILEEKFDRLVKSHRFQF